MFVRAVAAAVFGGLLVFNPVTLSVVGGMVAHHQLQQRAVEEVHERNFRTSCDMYQAATTWERWTTPVHWTFGWCENYLHRMS